MTHVLLLGSAPDALRARGFAPGLHDAVVVINNAWQVRPDWTALVHPHDFPADRLPPALRPGQRIVTQDDFVPAQNAYGGFVYAGGTMAFTAAYWVLHHYRPRVMSVLGCDMQYPAGRATHFYGTGSPDPLRPDVTLRSLPAKSARLMVLAAEQGCAMVNLSEGPSRLVFPRARPETAAGCRPLPPCPAAVAQARAREAALGYLVPSGRYWEEAGRFDPAEIDALDALWLRAAAPGWPQSA